MAVEQDTKSAFKLARLVNLARTTDIRIIEKILEQEGDINFAIPVDGISSISEVYPLGYTALHIASSNNNIALFKSLLNRNADFTKKDLNGNTALHKLITKQIDIKEPIDNPFVNAVLFAHVTSNIFSNPCNKDGLSHFHIACMISNSAAAQFFVDNGVLIDECVNISSEFYPGYTALHFSALCTNIQVVEVLVAQGANLHIRDAKGVTALHILLNRKLEMIDSLKNCHAHQQPQYQVQIEQNDRIINILMENMSSDNDCVDNIGLSNFHVASTLQDRTVAEQLADQVTDLNHCVNMDSPLWPGYTALHFAAHTSIKTLEMLIRKGANIEAEDSKGMTPLHICIEKYKIEDVCDIMSLNASWRNIEFSDGETKLLSFLRTFADHDYFKKTLVHSVKDINMQIPMESPLWPGYTPLHLAVQFAESSKHILYTTAIFKTKTNLQIIKLCLKNGADLKIQDKQGRTALHLAYRLGKIRAADVILSECDQIPNVSDYDNLSHLHIVCAVPSEKHMIKKCSLNNRDINVVYKGKSPINDIRPGSTPLHACLVSGFNFSYKLKMLLSAGANQYAKDDYGLTPIHRVMEINDKAFDYHCDGTKPLFAKVLDCVVEEYGLSHLHIACLMNNETAVKRLVKLGANVNLEIKCPQENDDDSLKFLSRYDKRTPLTISDFMYSGVIRALLKNRANVFAKRANGSSALTLPDVLEYYISEVLKKTQLQKSTRQEFGWTKLHFACYLRQTDGFEKLVKTELADVNAQVNSNSPIWKGYTPLHLLIHHMHEEKTLKMVKILLENGAVVTATDDGKCTPIMMSMHFNTYSSSKKLNYELATLLMKYYKDFGVNPVNTQGMSYFHLACYLNDFDTVQACLSHGVDVNHPIGFFSHWKPGYTPLHLASKIEVVELLISQGADVHKEDVEGCSVLAEALTREVFDENVVLKIIKSGANVNSFNFCGKTAFEIFLSRGAVTMEKLQFCIKQGFHVNSCNPVSEIGYLPIVFERNYQDKSFWNSIAETIANENPTTILGRTTLHNIVAAENMNICIDHLLGLFEKVVNSCCDIDAQDDNGRTPLHLAIEFENRPAVDALLRFGSDINVLDNNGNSAISYNLLKSTSSPRECDNIKDTLIAHACTLNFLKLNLNKINADLIAGKSIENYWWKINFSEQVIKTKQIEIGVRSMRLYDFLTETGAIMMYPSLNQSERSKIHEFFEKIKKDTSLYHIQNLLRLQYRKAMKRTELLFSATNSFRLLLGFDLPDLCAENIFQHLYNSDLTNIIRAQVENDEMKMDAN